LRAQPANLSGIDAMFRLFMRLSGWSAAVSLALGAAIVFVGSQISENADRLAAEGVDATATIIGKREIERHNANDTRTTDHLLRYHYPVGNGTLHYEERDVSGGFFDSMEVGQQIPVRFLPADPEMHEIEPGSVGDNAFYATLIGALFLLLGVLLAWLIGRKAQRMVRIRDHGARADATVEEVVAVSGSRYLKFRFADGQGIDRAGQSLLRRRRKIGDIEAGDQIPVRYDPQVPKRAYWERDLDL
jgi:hypothetical protein